MDIAKNIETVASIGNSHPSSRLITNNGRRYIRGNFPGENPYDVINTSLVLNITNSNLSYRYFDINTFKTITEFDSYSLSIVSRSVNPTINYFLKLRLNFLTQNLTSTRTRILQRYIAERGIQNIEGLAMSLDTEIRVLHFYLMFSSSMTTDLVSANGLLADIAEYKEIYNKFILPANMNSIVHLVKKFLDSTVNCCKYLLFPNLEYQNDISNITIIFRNRSLNISVSASGGNIPRTLLIKSTLTNDTNLSSEVYLSQVGEIQAFNLRNGHGGVQLAEPDTIRRSFHTTIANFNNSFLATNNSGIDDTITDENPPNMPNENKDFKKSNLKSSKIADFITNELIDNDDLAKTYYGTTSVKHQFVVKDHLIPGYYCIVLEKCDKTLPYYNSVREYARGTYQIFESLDSNYNLTNSDKYTSCELLDIRGSRLEPLNDEKNNYAPINYFKDNVICLGYLHPDLLINKDFINNYIEDVNSGIFYKKDDSIAPKQYNIVRPKVPGIKKGSSLSFKELTLNKPLTYVNTYGKKYTFGLEIETISGFIPRRFNNKLSFTAVHDGSLRQEDGNTYGLEYVTGIYHGDQGLLMTKKLVNELRKRCLINHQCSIHSHLGGVNFNKENIVLMYYIFQNLQDELLEIMPISRRNNEYCRLLPKVNIEIEALMSDKRSYFIDLWYNSIIKFLSSKDFSGKYINKKKQHPKGAKCSYDHSTARYSWVNMVPSVFDTRENGVYTIEFRLMSATTNYFKIKNWLLICFALVDIVENHKNKIYDVEFLSSGKNWTLDRLITSTYSHPKAQKEIFEFIQSRKMKFQKTGETSAKAAENSEYSEVEIDQNLKLINL